MKKGQMRKGMGLLLAGALVLLLAGGQVFAGEMKGHGNGKSMFGQMMKERQQMMTDMMGMMKEMMGILRNLNHKPSAAERERLGEMMQHMDEMMARHEEMHEMMRKRMKEMHGEHKMMKKNGHDMMDM